LFAKLTLGELAEGGAKKTDYAAEISELGLLYLFIQDWV